nr:immunoglobulin light chain junction region [Macaca mulatta]
YMQTLEFPWTF